MVEEFLHQTLVVLCGSLYQSGVQLCGFGFFGFGDVEFFGLSAFGFPTIHLHLEHVHYGVEVGACVDGILYESHLTAEALTELFECLVEVCHLFVELVDGEDDGFLHLVGIAELVLCAYLYTVLCIDEYCSLVCNRQRRYSSADKVVCTGAVDDVDFFICPLGSDNGWENGVSILLFDREIV